MNPVVLQFSIYILLLPPVYAEAKITEYCYKVAFYS
jgi:hypothetical protein